MKENEKMAGKAVGNIVLMMTVKWVLIIGISRALRKAAA